MHGSHNILPPDAISLGTQYLTPIDRGFRSLGRSCKRFRFILFPLERSGLLSKTKFSMATLTPDMTQWSGLMLSRLCIKVIKIQLARKKTLTSGSAGLVSPGTEGVGLFNFTNSQVGFWGFFGPILNDYLP